MSTVALVFLGAGVYVLAGWWLSGRFGNARLEPEVTSDTRSEVAPISAGMAGHIEFDTAVRGYRMDEVDRAIDQLQERIKEQAAEIAQLRGESASASSVDIDLPAEESGAAVFDTATSTGIATDAGAIAAANSAIVPHTAGMTSPVTIELRIEMPASAQTVWDAITDWPSQGSWMLGTKVWVGAGDGQSIGSRIDAFTGIGKLGFLDTMNITVWDPPTRCEVLHTGRVVRGIGWMATEPGSTGEGTCVFVWGERLELPWGWFGRLGWVIAGPLMKAGVKASLTRFQRLLGPSAN